MLHRYGQMSESLRLGAVLAAVGGFLEAYTFLCRGQVFANCETGNLVFMAMCLVQKQWLGALLYLAPVAAFFVGVLLTEQMRRLLSIQKLLHWRQVMLLLEIGCLAVTAFIPCGRLDVVVTTMISFVCSMQVESFRKVRGATYATTMCTGNLRSAAENLFVAARSGDRAAREKSRRYGVVVLSFVLGAMLGALCTLHMTEYAVLISCGILCIAFFMMFFPAVGERAAQQTQ